MGAGVTIGVDLNGVSKYPTADSMMDVIANSLDIAIDLRTKEQMKHADLAIRLDLSQYSRLDNHQRKDEIIQLGFKETTKQIQSLKRHQKFRFAYFIKAVMDLVTPIKIPSLFKKLKKQ